MDRQTGSYIEDFISSFTDNLKSSGSEDAIVGELFEAVLNLPKHRRAEALNYLRYLSELPDDT